jgi:hypothetical protein
MFFIETVTTSRLPSFGCFPLNTFLSVVCMAAVATELGVFNNFIYADLFLVKNVSCRALLLYLLILAI